MPNIPDDCENTAHATKRAIGYALNEMRRLKVMCRHSTNSNRKEFEETAADFEIALLDMFHKVG